MRDRGTATAGSGPVTLAGTHVGATHASPLRGRRSMRLRGYDYAAAGLYFVTVCAYDRACLFGEVVDGQVQLTDAGRILETCWRAIPDHCPHTTLDSWVVMPNHVHGIIVLGATHAGTIHVRALHAGTHVRATHASPLRAGSLGAIVGSFKSAVTRRINALRGGGGTVWQRNYHEHVIRNERDLRRIRRYIADNPVRWSLDRENPTPSTCPT